MYKTKKTFNNNSKRRRSPPLILDTNHTQGFLALRDEKNKKLFLHNLLERDWSGFSAVEDYIHHPMDDEERTMTRTTRSRRPRLHSVALQSGYCAVCHIHYISLDDHIQSKKHQKLIGDDSNFISINGFNTSPVGALLGDFNGIRIGVNGKLSQVESSCKAKQTTRMPNTRAKSGFAGRKILPPLSPARSECGHRLRSRVSPARSDTGHHLRSRRQINYALMEDDNLLEKLEKDGFQRPRKQVNYVDEDSLTEQPDNQEVRSSSRLIAKLHDQENEEVWNSGRPKRSCNRPKPPEEPPNNKSFYKVEVSSKLRSSGINKEQGSLRKRSLSPSVDNQKIDSKSLIVKFKKMRNSELVRLNNEAENFLFPKKDDSSSDEEVEDDATTNTESVDRNDIGSTESEHGSSRSKFKSEDEASMDSISSEGKLKRRRRTHAEAFIMDNQKYYKFETPGSRLRYQGNFLPTPMLVPKSPKHNGDFSKSEKTTDNKEKGEFHINLDELKFSFETAPKNEHWYDTFQRQDRGEENYIYFSDDAFWNPFLLPYQMRPLTPLDPKTCIAHYQQVKKLFTDPPSASSSGSCSTPDPCASTSSYTVEIEDDDTKTSTFTNEHSEVSNEVVPPQETKSETKKSETISSSSGSKPDLKKRNRKSYINLLLDKNPRKSPRQHASTLAILSSLINQRKKKSKSPEGTHKGLLSPIAEEPISEPVVAETPSSQLKLETPSSQLKLETPSSQLKLENSTEDGGSSNSNTPVKRKPGRKPRINYKAIAQSIDEELTSFEPELDNVEIDICEGENVLKSRMNVIDVLKLYEECKVKEGTHGTRRFLSGTPARKPGRKKKTNRTGWPNRIKKMMRKDRPKEDADDSNVESGSVNADSEDFDVASEEGTKNKDNFDESAVCDENVENCESDRVALALALASDVPVPHNASPKKIVNNNSVVNNKPSNMNMDLQFQPYVRVQKLPKQISSSCLVKKNSDSPKRTVTNKRRMPASPRSPRLLRKPRGRWYKER